MVCVVWYSMVTIHSLNYFRLAIIEFIIVIDVSRLFYRAFQTCQYFISIYMTEKFRRIIYAGVHCLIFK